MLVWIFFLLCVCVSFTRVLNLIFFIEIRFFKGVQNLCYLSAFSAQYRNS